MPTIEIPDSVANGPEDIIDPDQALMSDGFARPRRATKVALLPATKTPVETKPVAVDNWAPSVIIPSPGDPEFPEEETSASGVNYTLPALPNTLLPPQRKVALLLPQYKTTNPLTLYSIMGCWDRTKCGAMMHYGDALIVHSRDSLANRFVHESDFEWAWFVDDDMVLPMGSAAWFRKSTGWDISDEFAGAHALNRLLAAGKTLVGGLYFGRNHRGEGKCMFAEGMADKRVAQQARSLRSREVRPTNWVGTGCMLIHRSVFIDIEKRFPHLRPAGPGKWWHYFTPTPDAALAALQKVVGSTTLEEARKAAAAAISPATMFPAWSGEDVVFCHRAKQAGHQPHVDMGLVLGHCGSVIWGPTNTREA